MLRDGFLGFLGNAGFTPEVVNATAHVSLENIDGGWSVTKSHLVMNATIPGISAEQFQEIAAEAKAKCPIRGCSTLRFLSKPR